VTGNQEKRALLEKSQHALAAKVVRLEVARKELLTAGADAPSDVTAQLGAQVASLQSQLTAAAHSLVDRLDTDKRRPKIEFIDVVRDDAGELIGLRPIYEGQD
jgi:hypothetical protein